MDPVITFCFFLFVCFEEGKKHRHSGRKKKKKVKPYATDNETSIFMKKMLPKNCSFYHCLIQASTSVITDEFI